MRKPLLLTVAALLLACGAGRAADSDDKLVRDLVAEFTNPKNSNEVRSTAIRALAALGWPGKSAIPDLIKFLDNPEERKAARETTGPYYHAIEALGRLGPVAREAVPSLVMAKGIAAAYDQAIDAALENILIPPPGTVFNLLAPLRDNDPSARLMAAKALRTYPVDASLVLPLLRDAAANDPDPDVKRVAAESVEAVTKREVERLAGLLKDKDENVRVLAAKALGRMGLAAKDALPALKEAAEDKDKDVSCVAKNAIEKIQSAPRKP
jgi:HEAT repeat protein